MQIWVVLILSHIVYALRERIATAANCEPFEVSVPLLVELLPELCSTSELQLERLVQEGRQLDLLRASPRLALIIPQVELSCYQSVPPDLPRQRPGRAPAAPRARAPKPTTRVCGYQVQRQGVRPPKRLRRSEPLKPKSPGELSRQRQSPDQLLI